MRTLAAKDIDADIQCVQIGPWGLCAVRLPDLNEKATHLRRMASTATLNAVTGWWSFVTAPIAFVVSGEQILMHYMVGNMIKTKITPTRHQGSKHLSRFCVLSEFQHYG